MTHIDDLASVCSDAFERMTRGDRAGAAFAVAVLVAAGPTYVDATAAGWIDPVAEFCEIEVGTVLELTYSPIDGAEHDEDDAPPLVAWAGRLFAARVARDTDRYNALMREATGAPDDGIEHMVTLLGVLVDSLNNGSNRPPSAYAHLN